MKAINETIDQKLDAVETVLSEIIDPITIVGNPEKLIGKHYDSWTPEDLQRLTAIYGTDDKSPLSNLIFRRILERVQEMEKEEV